MQGADILADQGFLVVMPDFFHGKPMAQEDYPPDNEDKKKRIGAFFEGPADITKNLKALSSFATAASKEFPSVQNHAILGFCWGAKVAIKAADKRDVFKAVAAVHPAMVDAADAKDLTAPIMMLASKDEPADDVSKFKDNLPSSVKDQSVVETYDNMFHGWAAARANLDDEENKKEFKRAYEQLSTFFTKLV